MGPVMLTVISRVQLINIVTISTASLNIIYLAHTKLQTGKITLPWVDAIMTGIRLNSGWINFVIK